MLRAFLVITLAAACARSAPPPACPAPAAKPFAMKQYTFVLLKRGPAWTPEKTPETAKIFEGHMANIKEMARAKKLVLAGPLDAAETDRDAYAGLFIFDTSAADVDALLAKDPAIAIGRLVPEVRTWYGPAGLTYDGVEESLR